MARISRYFSAVVKDCLGSARLHVILMAAAVITKVQPLYHRHGRYLKGAVDAQAHRCQISFYPTLSLPTAVSLLTTLGIKPEEEKRPLNQTTCIVHDTNLGQFARLTVGLLS